LEPIAEGIGVNLSEKTPFVAYDLLPSGLRSLDRSNALNQQREILGMLRTRVSRRQRVMRTPAVPVSVGLSGSVGRFGRTPNKVAAQKVSTRKKGGRSLVPDKKIAAWIYGRQQIKTGAESIDSERHDLDSLSK